MEAFTTKTGAILERRVLREKGECKEYEFITRKKESHGESIEFLGVFTLIDPEYFTKKFIEEN